MNIVLIPAYNPAPSMIPTIQQLVAAGVAQVVVVNDGSAAQHADLFAQVAQLEGCTLLTHTTNQGKGRALKTGFNHILVHYPDCTVACADADGQHLTADILACLARAKENQNALVLGSRNFDAADVPLRSRIGNKATCVVMNIFCGVSIPDTQTGLRAMHSSLLPSFMQIKGERFEYETNMLVDLKKYSIDAVVQPIETVYLEDNKTSSFRPVVDSAKIYKVFAIYILVALFSFLVDISVFAGLTQLLGYLVAFEYISILMATAGARGISSITNYMLNRMVVFQRKNDDSSLVRYYCLWAAQLLISASGVYLLHALLGLPSVQVKIAVDFVLFFFSFYVQRRWVFR